MQGSGFNVVFLMPQISLPIDSTMSKSSNSAIIKSFEITTKAKRHTKFEWNH